MLDICVCVQDETSIFPTNCSVGIHGYVLVYSITSKASLETCKVIHDKILDMIGANRCLTIHA
jgi:Ras family protein